MLKCKICGKEFDGSQECVAPCGHAFHMSCLVSSPTCLECKTAIDVDHVKTLSDPAVSSKTEKDRESEVKDKEIEAKDQKRADDKERTESKVKDKGKDQEGESSDPENIPDRGESKAGVYDLSAYVQTLEHRIEWCMNRMSDLMDINEVLVNKATNLEKQNMDLGQANICLRRQLHMLHNFQKLNIASEDDFGKTIASISEKPDAVQKLAHYCTILRKQLLRIRTGERWYGIKRKRVGTGNLEEPCCSNQLSERNSESEEIINQDEFDLLNIESGELCCEVEKGIGQNEIEPSDAGGRDGACSSDAGGRDGACSSDAVKNQLAVSPNVPLDANSSDVCLQDELS